MTLRKCFALLIAATIISACIPIESYDSRVTLYEDESWEGQTEVVVSTQLLRLMQQQIEASFDQNLAQWRQSGIQANWKRTDHAKEGTTSYIMTAKGKGWDRLNMALFNGAATITSQPENSRPRVAFRYSAAALSVAQRFSLTLVGGRIISSNGTQSGSQVSWTNASQTMEAVLEPASRTGGIALALIVAGGLLLAAAIVGGVLTLWRKRPTPARVRLGSPWQPEAGAPVDSYPPWPVDDSPAPSSTCQACGAALPDEAVFCPRCGTRR